MALTLKQMLNEVLSRSGFVQESSFVGGDIDAVQMVSFANQASLEFRNFYPWPKLRKTDTITMDGSLTYDLASDFHYLVPESMYQQEHRRPVFIPATDEIWGYLKANSDTSGIVYIGKLIGGKVVFDQETSGDTITYDYISKYPVQATGGGATKERFTVDTDEFLLDEETLIMGIMGYWQLQKGIETAAPMMALFRKKMREFISEDAGAKTIRPYRKGPRGPISNDYQW